MVLRPIGLTAGCARSWTEQDKSIVRFVCAVQRELTAAAAAAAPGVDGW